jgi:hypothetical protein
MRRITTPQNRRGERISHSRRHKKRRVFDVAAYYNTTCDANGGLPSFEMWIMIIMSG